MDVALCDFPSATLGTSQTVTIGAGGRAYYYLQPQQVVTLEVVRHFGSILTANAGVIIKQVAVYSLDYQKKNATKR